MPAAAVIPAPIAYIKAVAVKKLVVEFRAGACGPPRRGYCMITSAQAAVRRPAPSGARGRAEGRGVASRCSSLGVRRRPSGLL